MQDEVHQPHQLTQAPACDLRHCPVVLRTNPQLCCGLSRPRVLPSASSHFQHHPDPEPGLRALLGAQLSVGSSTWVAQSWVKEPQKQEEIGEVIQGTLGHFWVKKLHCKVQQAAQISVWRLRNLIRWMCRF